MQGTSVQGADTLQEPATLEPALLAPASLADLDDDLLLRTMGLLAAAELLALGATDRRLRALASRDELWAPLCAARWSLPLGWAARARSWPAWDQPGGPAFRKLPPRARGPGGMGELVRLCEIRTQPELNGMLAIQVVHDESRERTIVVLLRRGVLPAHERTAGEVAGKAKPEGPRPAFEGAGGLRAIQPENLGPLYAPGPHLRTLGCPGEWQLAWARRLALDTLVRAEVAYAHAGDYKPGSSARTNLVGRGEWLPDWTQSSGYGVRAIGQWAWECLRAHLPAELQNDSGYLQGALTPLEILRAPSVSRSAAPIAFAIIKDVNRDVRLQDWVRITGLAEAGRHVPLEAGALIISAWDDPLCDVRGVAQKLDSLGADLTAAIRKAGKGGGSNFVEATPEALAAANAADAAATAAAESADAATESAPRVLPRAQLVAANQLLYGELGINSVEREYYDIRNSLLQYVLLCEEWRHALPISLAVVYQAVCARAGLHLEPVSLPFHFVLGVPMGQAAALGVERLFVDVFGRGKLLTDSDARELITSRANIAWSEQYVTPCAAQDVWLRMLRNLVHVGQSHSPSAADGGWEPYGTLLAWASASSVQRQSRIDADFVLAGLMRTDLAELAHDTARAGRPSPTTPPTPPPAAVSGKTGAAAGGSSATSVGAWPPPGAASVTEVLGLWAVEP